MNLCLPLSLKNGNLGVPTSWTCSQNFCGQLFLVIQESSWEGGWMWVAWCHRIPEVFREKAAEWKWQGRSCWNYSCQQLVAALIENVRLNRFINFSSLQVCRWNEQKGLIESCTKNRRGELVGEGCPCHNVWEPHVWNERIWKLQVNCRADVRVTKGCCLISLWRKPKLVVWVLISIRESLCFATR